MIFWFGSRQVFIRAEARVAEKVNDNITSQVVNNDTVDRVEIVYDEFCNNTGYSTDKSSPTPSPIDPPPPPSRELGSFDYYLMIFEDYCEDPD